MSKVYLTNSEQVGAYDNLIEKLWEMGKGNDDLSGQTMKAMLESPEMSQRLMSAFFYYDP